MALVIAVVGLKGGIGKSTIAVNVATCLHRDGHRVLLVDTDAQGTSSMWSAAGAEAGHDGPTVVSVEGKGLRRDIENLGRGFDVLVIDGPPKLGTETRSAMVVADLVVLPATPGAADLWALAKTVEIVEEARALAPGMHAAIVANRTDRTALATALRKHLAGFGLPLLETSLGARVAFGEATLGGQGVIDYAPDSDAAREVRRLVRELLGVLKERTDAA